MKILALAVVITLIFLTSCAKNIATPQIENNQSIYYGKLEKIKFINVKDNQSLEKIAEQNSVPVSEIKRLNSLTNYQSLKSGQILKLPIAKFHKISDDESIEDIARIYDVSYKSLLEENNLRDGDKLSAREYIRIPETSSDYEAHRNNTHVAFQESTIMLEQELNKEAEAEQEEENVVANTKHFKNRSPLNSPDFIWPIQGKVLKKYGNYNGKLNDGINIAAPKGKNILAAGDGEVVFTGYKPEKFGNLVIIRHNNGYMSAYSHCDKILVVKNEFVKKGTPIATIGSTGNVTQSQLQFTMKKGNHIIDPDG